MKRSTRGGGQRWSTWLVAGVLLVAACGGNSRGEPVAEVTTSGQQVTLFAPGGRLHEGKNQVTIRVISAGTQKPLDVPSRLEFVRSVAGSPPVRTVVAVQRRGPGEYRGEAVLDGAGKYWAEVTLNGPEGTNTVRLRFQVDQP